MAAPMWRMNGLWRRMAGVLVLCALLLSYEVTCQEDAAADATDAPAADPAAAATADATDPPATPDNAAAPDAGTSPPAAAGGESASSVAPEDVSLAATVTMLNFNLDNLDVGLSGTLDATAAPAVAAAPDPDNNPVTAKVVPNVECVKGSEISESNAIKAEVATDDCEETKRIILENPAPWCGTEKCELKISQDDKMLLLASEDAGARALAEALQSEDLKEKLGVTMPKVPSSSSNSSVFVGILVSGLLAALAITVGYFKCQRRSDTKGVRLAEEAYPVDQENQGNTLVSVAPLTPPPETPEKPSVNGESPEAAKTQPPPPTNGHSTTKTADTEL